jgi:hypothetical protein
MLEDIVAGLLEALRKMHTMILPVAPAYIYLQCMMLEIISGQVQQCV